MANDESRLDGGVTGRDRALSDLDALGSRATDEATATRPTRINGTKRRVDAATRSEIDWTPHVMRVRDAQDHAAFAELFAYFAPRIKAFLMKGGADEAQAEECVQDVMATLWRKAHLFDPARATVATWIFTIARNRRIDLLRKERRPEPEDLPWGPEEELGPAETVAQRQEQVRLTAALARLPDKQRDLINQAYFGDLSHSEIARVTGLPLGTIKSRIRLALERLRHELKASD